MPTQLRRFWESKKWLAFGGGVVIAIITYILNLKYGLGIDTSAVLALIGLNGIYILAQGKIDTSKSAAGAMAKSFWDSNKAIAVLVGDLVPLIVASINAKFGLGIDPMVILGFMGLSGVYVLRQTSIDLKNPDQH